MPKPIPYDFVLHELDRLAPYTKPMFGFVGVYVGDKIVLCLNDNAKRTPDTGVWIATFKEHHESLRKALPSMRSLSGFGSGPTDWQVLPADSLSFEEEVLLACGLILEGDPRIGKTPKRKSVSKKKKAPSRKPAAVKAKKKAAVKRKR